MAPEPTSWVAGCGVVMGGLDALEEMLMCCWAGVQACQLVLGLIDIPRAPREEGKNGASSPLPPPPHSISLLPLLLKLNYNVFIHHLLP